MENLVQLVSSLKKSEVHFIQHYYKQDTDKKRLQFFNAILGGELKTDEAAAKKFYGKKGAAYSQLKSRLTKDLLNLLLFEEGSKQSESERFQNEVEVLRNILIGKILFNRKVHKHAVKVWEHALNVANEFEFLKEKIFIKDLLSESVGVQSGIEEFERIQKDIDKDTINLQKLLLAKKLYWSVAIPSAFFKNNENEFKKLAQNSVVELKKIFNDTASPNIGYFYYLTAINYSALIRDFEEFFIIAKELLALISSQKSLYSKARLVNAYMQIYTASMYLGNYSEALENAKSAFDFTLKGGINELTVIEYQLLSSFQLRDNVFIQNFIRIGSNHPRILYSKFTGGKWIFYKAIAHFFNNDFQLSLSELQKENELLKDKSGWLFGHKLLEIMCYIELGEFDMIEFRVEALRKLLQRQKDKNIIRMKTIFSIIGTFIKTGASFKNTLALESDKLALLQEGKDEHYWDPLGFEIIRFDSWFTAKANS